MRCLGLDLGTKTLGVAISDKTNTLARPLKVIRFKDSSYEMLVSELKLIIDENEIGTIVLGLPKNMDNSLGFATERSLKFKALLEKNIDIPVVLVDERLTTLEAENILINVDMRRDKRKKVIDAVAAVLILETYLKREWRNS